MLSKDFKKFGPYLGHLYSAVTTMQISDLSELFEAFRRRVQLNLDRDMHSAKNLAAQRKSGLHFVGLNHFNNTVENLERLCKSATSR